MTFKYWTRNDINDLLRSNDKAVERAIVRLFELQNADEQRFATTNVHNNRGFCSSDARAGTRFARWIQGLDDNNRKKFPAKSLNHPKAQRVFRNYCKNGEAVIGRARRIALKHSKQLVEIANEKANKPSGMTKAEKDEMNRQTRERLGAGWETTKEEVFGVNPAAGTTIHISAEPQPGTWAATARIMAEGDDSGFDWDEWKDRMKDRHASPWS
jgi:glutamate mutase epsilon subunit